MSEPITARALTAVRFVPGVAGLGIHVWSAVTTSTPYTLARLVILALAIFENVPPANRLVPFTASARISPSGLGAQAEYTLPVPVLLNFARFVREKPPM